MYNFPIAFRNVYHQRCTTTDVCSCDLKENNTDTLCSKKHLYGYG